jgi:hypothetical protein
MATLPTPTISTKRFFYDRPSNQFSIDASDMGKDFEMGQAYDDSADVGFTLVSAKTGREVRLVQSHVEINKDRELLYEDYVPAEKSEQGLFKVRIYND